MTRSGSAEAQFIRAVPRRGASVPLTLDGQAIMATEGESVLAALLSQRGFLRRLEFGGEPRAGFCLMGACQDCWVWTETGGRLRACTTPVAAGMALSTATPALRP
ncbi:(2Fe-2S)-binding protein [Bosea lathyri]|uniref:2Fe-2S iron-sulfur cluster binding domain-containing protein n=1 Tax=Bosea lathyri TaxID=1036778 RepID=A0A1H5YQE6_9HYPH|nr:(2Fe-2S)-binding protein [Bosea lathyri]SEG26301.1 2Fe-2S iron-sulfur cluster binding domain-containing protein [Bosea lathyri]